MFVQLYKHISVSNFTDIQSEIEMTTESN